MQFRITPGIHKLFRLALVEDNGEFITLSEHDNSDDAVFAMKNLDRACSDAAHSLRRISA